MVGAGDVSHLSLLDELFDSCDRLVPGRGRVGLVKVVDVDPIGAEPLETRLAVSDDAVLREAALRSIPADTDLRRDHDLVADSAQGRTQVLLRGTAAVDVRRIEVVDTQVEGGRWLVEAGSVLSKPSQRIRVDLLQPGSATVIGRAEVDFLVELPPGEEPTAIATAEPAPHAIQPEASPETASPAAEPAPPATAQVTPPAATAPSAQPAAPADNTAPNPAPAQPAGSTSTAVTETPATPAAQPATADAPVAQTPASQPAQAVPSAATANAATPETPAVAQAPATSAEATPDIPTMVAVSIGGADAQRFAAGKAIIRRGDNLWTIARRVYGTGIKFTTIYEANAGQIRDPDRIYPGQVFNLPTQ